MQTTSFELSEKLKKKKVPQNGTFEHVNQNYMPKESELNYEFRLKHPDNLFYSTAIFADAFTLDEILEMLPSAIEAFYDLWFHKSMDHTYWLGYRKSLDDALFLTDNYQNPAEAAGQLLLWCIENGYVEVGREKSNV